MVVVIILKQKEVNKGLFVNHAKEQTIISYKTNDLINANSVSLEHYYEDV